jgi:ERCC4-related helicase
MQNTLVSLPTGLGKTLIAAVVMYNYYRWFPTGKVVFCAPTRPLVSQQIHAWYVTHHFNISEAYPLLSNRFLYIPSPVD